jgi:hypothetical protein
MRVANFRAERVFVMLREPIDGFDHFNAVEPSELCTACVLSETDSESLGLEPLFSFGVAQGERSWEPREKPKWRAASKGLSTVRGLLAHYDDRIAKGEGSCGGLIPSALPKIAAALRRLEAVLDKADTYDRKFCFAVKDLA